MNRRIVTPQSRRARAYFRATLAILLILAVLYGTHTAISSSPRHPEWLVPACAVIAVVLLISAALFVARAPARVVARPTRGTYDRAQRRLRRRVQRRWIAACRDAGVTREDSTPETVNVRTPRVASLTPISVGLRLCVEVIQGQDPADLVKAAPRLGSAFGVTFRALATSPSTVTLTAVLRDSLASPLALDRLPAANDLKSVPFAVGEDGVWRVRNLANNSGVVVIGVPGSGKTVAEGTFVARLIQNPAVQVVVIDGKGGGDWSWVEPRAAIYCNDDDDLVRVAEITRSIKEFMRGRLRTQLHERGESNFWSLPLDPEHPFLMVLVDEVQTFTDTKGMPKEAKALCDAITADLTTLEKKGRSAGLMVVSMTQKATADAIPTALRDNASIRDAFRVTTREGAVAGLGDAVSGSDVTPVDIAPSTPGVAVVGSDSGALERVRWPYVPESILADIARRTAHLRRDLTSPETEGAEA